MQGDSIVGYEGRGTISLYSRNKKEDINQELCDALWGDKVFEFFFSPTVGTTGDLLCIWNKDALEATNLVVGNGFIFVEGFRKEKKV